MSDPNKITPIMIAAGQACLDELIDRATAPGEGLVCIPDGWAEAVYRVMRRAAEAEEASVRIHAAGRWFNEEKHA